MDVRELFELPENEGQSKVMPLSEAIRKAITPGMKLHLSVGCDPSAAIREVIRQFWGKNPQITLISSGVTTPYTISLIHAGLVRKVITTNCSYTYPTPRPVPLIQKAYKKGLIEIESWTTYSLEQRLMAGALGVGFMPTKSTVGTDLAKENTASFRLIDDPFHKGRKEGVIEALVPDLSITSGCVADPYGNTILALPYFSSIWGPRASRNGVIVTVEKLVSTEFIRRHANLVRIPGYLVKAVCVVPFAAHPQGLIAQGVEEFEGYSEDYEFSSSYLEISKDPATLDGWIKEWILDVSSQEDYLCKLGPQKLASLKARATPDAWKHEMESFRENISADVDCNSTEMMVIAAAWEIKKKVIQNDYKTILAGIGTPGLAAWLAYYLLQAEGHWVDLVAGSGQLGYAPRPGDPFLISLSNVATSKVLTDVVEAYGTFVSGANNNCLSVLGAAQVDKFGNINSVKIGDLYLIGSGGACDAINSKETVVVAKQSRERFLEDVSFITCPGENAKMLVTDLAVFEKRGEELVVTKYITGPGFSTREARIKEIKERCGWDLKVAETLEEVGHPTARELVTLRSLDPYGFFISPHGGKRLGNMG